MNAAIVLAAGGSSRLGRPKQLLEFRGKSLLRVACETATVACPEQVLVVVGCRAEEMRGEFAGVGRAVVNLGWEEGMASSIRCGVEALDSGTDAALLMLCDQPLVAADHLRRLLDSVSSQLAVCASVYGDGRLGAPAAFHRSKFGELMALRGDRGARELMGGSGVVGVEGAVLVDIDTLADFEELEQYSSSALPDFLE